MDIIYWLSIIRKIRYSPFGTLLLQNLRFPFVIIPGDFLCHSPVFNRLSQNPFLWVRISLVSEKQKQHKGLNETGVYLPWTKEWSCSRMETILLGNKDPKIALLCCACFLFPETPGCDTRWLTELQPLRVYYGKERKSKSDSLPQMAMPTFKEGMIGNLSLFQLFCC